MTKKNKSTVISIRLRDEDYLKYKEAISELGVSDSEFFRSLITDTFDPEKMNKSRNNDLSKMLFYYNKSSNNINQLAKSINTSMKSKTMNDSLGNKLLIKLDLILQSFNNGIKEVDK